MMQSDSPSKRLCFTLDLKNDPDLISQYREYHCEGKVWPEVIQSIKQAGVLDMHIYLSGNRLFMIVDVTPDFSLQVKAQQDAANPKVVAWEKLMDTFQQRLPWAKPGEKWTLMDSIFSLPE